MTTTEAASLVVSGAGIASGVATFVMFRRFDLALSAALELWTGAGLLRLTAEATWRAVAAAGAIVLVRKLITMAIKRPRAPAA